MQTTIIAFDCDDTVVIDDDAKGIGEIEVAIRDDHTATERRRLPRLEIQAFQTVVEIEHAVTALRQTATIIDSSAQGIAFAVKGPAPYQEGDAIRVFWNDITANGTVRNVRRFATDVVRLGVSFPESPSVAILFNRLLLQEKFRRPWSE